MRHLTALSLVLFCCSDVPVGTKEDGGTESDSGVEEESSVYFGGFEISPGSVDFGNVTLGQTKEATLTLTNTDSTESMISNAFVSGDSAFGLLDDVEIPLTVSGESSTVLTFSFTPTELGRTHASLSLGVAGEVGYGEIELTGKGKEGGSASDDTGDWTGDASLSVSPSSVDFGTIAVLNSTSQVLSLTNTGTTDVLITSLNITNAAFSVDPSFSIPLVIAQGSSQSMPLIFAPSSEGLHEAILDIATEPADASVYVDLTGIAGEADCTICAPVLSVSTSTGGGDLALLPPFGYGCTATGSAVLTNSGDQSLDINQVTVRNDTISSCGSFARSWAGATTLEPGASTTVAVDYVAESACIELPYASLNENVMHVRSSDPAQPDVVVELSATVLLCE